jgi:hypothetical protein
MRTESVALTPVEVKDENTRNHCNILRENAIVTSIPVQIEKVN